ncbi:TIGR03089 family protein [Mycolicibacterium litorale]|uniref:TIGR03089 family protein n=1 Tax=Mycolicibacterium litorale TaxID=758802 RepID=A0A6S6P032_9MYCO|nr:TIGR03089 family protein [Mycolicibacterium litorale]BCI52114.1 TIGR03089 family protein [Mycolicibacterium litorale]
MCELTVTAALLGPLLDSDPAGPSITYYDDATGERIEVSAVTLANWAAKTGNLLRDELGAGPSSRIAVLLPAHWQTAAVLFGLWWIGAEALVGGGGDGADVALCTADRIDEADAAVGAGEIAVLSLDPFGRPVPDLPVGITDYATAVRVHGDQIVPERAPGPALDGRAVDDVLAAAARAATAAGLQPRDRVLSTAEWATADDVVSRLLAVYAVGGSLVQVAHPDSDALERRRAMEKVTRTLA